MRDINLFNIQLMDVELILNIAKYGSFTKAGEKMFMTQSVVSKRINQIENELGLTLFIRDKRKVILTPAGRVLSRRFKNISDDILDAIQEAHIAQTGASGSLSIGFLEWANPVFINCLQNFIRENPQFSVSIFRKRFSELRTDVIQGNMDIIFTTSYDCTQFSDKEFDYANVSKIPLMAYMSRQNPLSSCPELSINDLRKEPMLMVNPRSSSGYGEYVKQLFARYGIKPIISQYANDGGEHIGNLLINKGILLASANFLDQTLTDPIARIPVTDEHVYVTAVWRKDNINLVLMKFLTELLEEVDPEKIR